MNKENRLPYYGVTLIFGLASLGCIVISEIPQGLRPVLLEAAVTTAKIFLASALLGLLVAAVLSLAPRVGTVAALTMALIHGCRCTPIVCALLVIYWIPPIIGLSVSSEVCAILAISLIEGGNLAFIIRSIQSRIWDIFNVSCFALGLTKHATLTRIVVPLLLAVAMPHVYNFILYNLSAAALSSFIGVVEITQAARILATTLVDPISTYCIMFLFYLCISSLSFFTIHLIEQSVKNIDIVNEVGINYD